MRVVATGVTGFLGSHVAEALVLAGHEVVALARNPEAIDADLRPYLEPRGAGPPSLRILRGSLADAEALCEAAAGAEAAVHVAGLIQARNEAEYMRVNRDGTEAFLRAVEAKAPRLCRFVLISSLAAGGPCGQGSPLSGAEPPMPVSAYGRSKLAGEERALVRASRLPVTIIRPPVIFGARDRMLARLFRAVTRGRSFVWGDGLNAFSVVHAPDVAAAVRLSLEKAHPSGSILYTSDERAFTWRSFTEALAGVTGARPRILSVPPAAFMAVGALTTAFAFLTRGTPLLSWDKIYEMRERAWLCTSRRARSLLDWAPSGTVEEALRATHAWYRSRGLL